MYTCGGLEKEHECEEDALRVWIVEKKHVVEDFTLGGVCVCCQIDKGHEG